MHFLQNMLAQVENMNNMDGYAWWWIGLNDLEEEGQYLWPVGGPANFTWWDEEYEEPYDPYGDYDCVEMLSADCRVLCPQVDVNILWWYNCYHASVSTAHEGLKGLKLKIFELLLSFKLIK